MRRLVRRIPYLLHRGRIEADLAEEMQLHRELLAADEQTSRRWGNAALAREDARAIWIAPWIESVRRDLIYGLRGLVRQPGFSFVAIGALAIAIGLNSSVFTLFNAVAVRPWPVKDTSRVVNLMRAGRKGPGVSGFGVAESRYLNEHSKAFSGLFVSRGWEHVQVSGRMLSLTWVSGNYFQVLGVDVARGRVFVPEEDVPQSPVAVAVLSYTAWRNRFGADPSIVGKSVRLDEIPFTIVGVAPENFAGTDLNRPDFWAPFSAMRVLRPREPYTLPLLTGLNYCCFSTAGRLASGYTRRQAAEEVDLLMSQAHSTGEAAGLHAIVRGTAAIETMGRDESLVPVLTTMFVAMTLVLILACANVGNFMLARAAARRVEIAVRLSLGGSRTRIVRQLFVEALALALIAAAIGLVVASIAPGALVNRLEPDTALHYKPDLLVCLYTAGIAVAACLVFGLAPALHGTRGRISTALRRDATASRTHLPFRSVLLGAQVAISVILLAEAGLLVRGVQRSLEQDPGFRIGHNAVAALNLPAADYGGERARAFTTSLQNAVTEASLDIALSSDAPFSNGRSFTALRRAADPPGRDTTVDVHEVTAQYFRVLGVPLVAGRHFTREDSGRNVILLNEAAAKRYFGVENAIGQNMISNQETWQVVGVVRDAHISSLGPVYPTMYWPMSGRFGVPQAIFDDSSPRVRERLTAIVFRLEPKARVAVTPLAGNLRSRVRPATYGAALSGALGLIAIALAAIGMSGVLSWIVRQRTHEIGVRMALGARPAQVVRLILASNFQALGWGLAAGIGGAIAATQVLRSVSTSITPLDPVSWLAVLALLLVAAAAATAIPARRAARIDPAIALRRE